MKVDVIETKADYLAALDKVEKWVRSGELQHHPLIDALTALIMAYEKKHYPLPDIDPIDAIRFRLEELQWSQNKSAVALGLQSGRFSEIMNKRRPLTLPMIRVIEGKLDIPASTLIQQYQLSTKASLQCATGSSEAGNNNLTSS